VQPKPLKQGGGDPKKAPRRLPGRPRRIQKLPRRPQKAPGGSKSFPENTKRRREIFGFRTGWLKEAIFETPKLISFTET
jgi:hypothetical protein